MAGYRTLSLWHETAGDDFAPRPSLPGPVAVDVAIAGAGYTGLWTAYYLKRLDPSLRIIVLEKEVAGFGASGRNGGWCSHYVASPRERMARDSSRAAVMELLRTMRETVAEVGAVVAREGISCDFHPGGALVFATNAAQLRSLQEELAYERSWGCGPEDLQWLPAPEARERIAVEGALGALFSPHCARVHPAKLVRGLARVVEGLGVPIYELTPVREADRGGLRTPWARVEAEVVIMATESYSVLFPGARRDLVPLYSLMIATEPLPPEVWEKIGWEDRECWMDGRHLIIYVCRTEDGRVAIGGRGAPYHLGSRLHPSYEVEPVVFAHLKRTLSGLLPPTEPAAVTHRWGGPLALARDWSVSVGYDRPLGLAWARGYVGDGVATANLAGRTLADLISQRDTGLTRLPWVGHRSPRWEPEPLRWLGVNLAVKAMASADAQERRTGRPSRRAAIVERLIGR